MRCMWFCRDKLRIGDLCMSRVNARQSSFRTGVLYERCAWFFACVWFFQYLPKTHRCRINYSPFCATVCAADMYVYYMNIHSSEQSHANRPNGIPVYGNGGVYNIYILLCFEIWNLKFAQDKCVVHRKRTSGRFLGECNSTRQQKRFVLVGTRWCYFNCGHHAHTPAAVRVHTPLIAHQSNRPIYPEQV